MSSSDFLRKNLNQHSVKNEISKTMDKDIDIAVAQTLITLQAKYPEITFRHQKSFKLQEMVAMIALAFPQYAEYFTKPLETSFIKPDGGFVFAKNAMGQERLVLVAEVKRQGTNDKRAAEGMEKQAMGNAIERLGKNLIGIKCMFKNEGVLPFICFGQGHDFSDGSSILDRVVTMNEFFPLNEMFVEKRFLPFEPATMYFRNEDWSVDEMANAMIKVATRAIEYKFV